ncbi:hypothetical protein [Methylophilus sp. YYY-1]|uniref:hypothetical protein n=1 Tax=Methylophilus sp. YYY-1 TaxID=2682087 RepID=UPI0023B3520A|nr:hypothetical protein [Methylophilus sp. YYY-1]MDF0379060.1 hypothetical protein [Methylophilus sp. YYY-1]
MDNTQPRQHPLQPQAHEVWQDQCRICLINGKLVALPYIEASRFDDYEFGATLAAINANRLIRKLVNKEQSAPC